MTKEAVARAVREVLLDWGVSEVRGDSKLGEDIKLDSLEFVAVQGDLEKKLGVDIDMIGMVEAGTFDQIVDYLHSLQQSP